MPACVGQHSPFLRGRCYFSPVPQHYFLNRSAHYDFVLPEPKTGGSLDQLYFGEAGFTRLSVITGEKVPNASPVKSRMGVDQQALSPDVMAAALYFSQRGSQAMSSAIIMRFRNAVVPHEPSSGPRKTGLVFLLFRRQAGSGIVGKILF